MEVGWRNLEPVNPDEIIVTIKCSCGNTRMTNKADGFPAEDIRMYRYGMRVKNFRCTNTPSSKFACTIPAKMAKKMRCQKLYRLTLHADTDEPFIEVVHLGVRPKDVKRIPFPKKVIRPPQPMYPGKPWPDPNPYRKAEEQRNKET